MSSLNYQKNIPRTQSSTDTLSLLICVCPQIDISWPWFIDEAASYRRENVQSPPIICPVCECLPFFLMQCRGYERDEGEVTAKKEMENFELHRESNVMFIKEYFGQYRRLNN